MNSLHVESVAASPPLAPNRAKLRGAILLTICLLPIVQGLALGWEPIDDAYITFRYARNWAEGNGLVFNPGERVEGYTNFLWAMFLALVTAVGLNPVSTAIVTCCVLTAVNVALTWRLASRVGDELGWSPAAPWIAAIAYAVYPGTAYWAFGGMETCLQTALMLGFLLVASERSRTDRPVSTGRLIACGLLGLGAALTRWECVLLWPVGVVCALFDRSRSTKARLMRAAVLSLVLVVPFAAYFYVRYRYYGDWMPNTYYAKAGGPVIDRLWKGIRYTGELGVGWLLPITGIAWLTQPIRRWTLVMLYVMVVFGAYVTWTGGDTFAWLRFYQPIIPICAVMGAGLVDRLARGVRVFGGEQPRRAVLASGFIGIVFLIALALDYDSARAHGRWLEGWRYVGSWLKESTSPDCRVAAAPIGVIGCYSDRRIIDVLGLTDREVAHWGTTDPSEVPGHQRSHDESILRRRPEIVVGNGLALDEAPSEEEAINRSARKSLKRLFRDPRFRELYEFRVDQYEGEFIAFWVRRDAEAHILQLSE